MPKKARKKTSPSKKRPFYFVIILIVIVGGVGAIAFHDGVFGTTPINNIITNPNDYVNLQVVVKGNITNRFTWYSLDVITVRDTSGASIMVDLSSYTGAVPPIGSIVVVQGKIALLLVFPYIEPTAISQIWVFP